AQIRCSGGPALATARFHRAQPDGPQIQYGLVGCFDTSELVEAHPGRPKPVLDLVTDIPAVSTQGLTRWRLLEQRGDAERIEFLDSQADRVGAQRPHPS